MAFRWQADDGPHIVVVCPLTPIQLKTKVVKVEVGPHLAKLSGSAYGGDYISVYTAPIGFSFFFFVTLFCDST